MSKRLLLFAALIAITGISLWSCQSASDAEKFLLGSGIGINNPTLMVNDVEATKKLYADTLGFNVGRAGEHPEYDNSVLATIRFSDFTTFEILAKNDTMDAEGLPTFISDFLENNEGVQHYALSTSSIDSTYQALNLKGFETDSVKDYRSSEVTDGWSRDDGSINRKSLDFDASNPPTELPRFIQKVDFDYPKIVEQWRTYHAFQRSFRTHPNGVVGYAALKLAVSDLEASKKEFERLGLKLIESDEAMAKYHLFKDQELHLVSGEPVADFISERGDGVFALQFFVENIDTTAQFFEEKLSSDVLEITDDVLLVSSDFAKGVQLEFIEQTAAQKEMAAILSLNGKLDEAGSKYASNIYTKYCALCHGDNREGYAADNAPSLRSKSLLATSMNNNFMRYTIQFGRGESAMAGYLDEQGGPLEYIDIEILLKWLYEEAGVEEAINPSREPVRGDIAVGKTIYDEKCAACHGANGEGVSAPALGNPMTLATATDHFLRYAIAEGRDGTPMVAFKDSLDHDELDAVTAFLRSRAAGWDVPEPSTAVVPTPDEYVLNPDGEAPTFTLRDDKFVSAAQVDQAIKEGRKMMIMDARSEVAWRQTHIPGSFPVPYYEEPESFINDIPNDDTQIVIYCACPHAASLRVMGTLKKYGYKNVSIIDEGILVWAQLGYPVRNGQ